MSEETKAGIPASLLKLEELRLDSIQYWARHRALGERRNELRQKLVDAEQYERKLIEGRRTFDDRRGGIERYDANVASHRTYMAALRELMAMVDAEKESIRVLEPTAELFRRAQQHFLDVTQGWARDAV